MNFEQPSSSAEQGREKEISPEKKSHIWSALRRFTLAGVLAIGAYEGMGGKETILQYLNEGEKITDVQKEGKKESAIEKIATKSNLGEIGDEDIVVEDISFRAGDKVYRFTIDTGIKKKDFAGGAGWEANPDNFGKMNSVLSRTSDVNGRVTAVLFEVTEDGLKQTRQEIAPNGKVESEESSYLTAEKPNVVEKEVGVLYPDLSKK